jgi:hypothetical protein
MVGRRHSEGRVPLLQEAEVSEHVGHTTAADDDEACAERVAGLLQACNAAVSSSAKNIWRVALLRPGAQQTIRRTRGRRRRSVAVPAPVADLVHADRDQPVQPGLV